ncbi:MAG: aminoacyl-histidine dipeptidase [Eubacteriaceae bacterium]|nr:aminoacyl-histidine dipeptidase [Eubacteriaceae bacterium]
MNVRELEPKKVFGFFDDISRIPRGSYNTKQISDFLADFAAGRELKYVQDELNNVIIYKNATEGYENAPVIILQGHMDMVCEKVDGCTKDMTKEGIDLAVDGDWLHAVDTTLGADNGIAVAIMLAILDSDDIKHPALECVFTVDEETGLEGAEGLDESLLKGRIMINLDSEDEGIFSVSCAGGITAEAEIPVTRTAAEEKAYMITIENLLGGHSGIEINKEHANANVVMGRVLDYLAQTSALNLVSAAGGSADNVICKKCEAVICTEAEDIIEKVGEMQKILSAEYHTSDPDISVSCVETTAEEMLTVESTGKVISYLLMAPNGVENFSMDIEGLVETSLNLGALNINEKAMTALYAIRSSVKTRQDYVCRKLDTVAKALGGSVDFRLYYPGWEYRPDSPIRDLCVKVYKDQYGREPEIVALHAGLECGFFAGKLGDDFDAISIGPDMPGVHTPDEKVSISSTQRLWKHICGILEEAKNL